LIGCLDLIQHPSPFSKPISALGIFALGAILGPTLYLSVKILTGVESASDCSYIKCLITIIGLAALADRPTVSGAL